MSERARVGGKAVAGTFIAISVALLAAAFIQLIATETFPQPLILLAILSFFFAGQAFAHYILSRIED